MVREATSEEMVGGLTWKDASGILYGAPPGAGVYEKLQFGGMSMSSDVYLQRSVQNIEDRRGWRIFSKLGFGFSGERMRFEITLNGYLCLPGTRSSGHGVEFAIAASVADPMSAQTADSRMQEVINNISSVVKNLYN